MDSGEGIEDCGSPIGPRQLYGVSIIRLESHKDATIFFRGNEVHFLSPCTASETQACRIAQHLPVLNSYLSQAKLEIHELNGPRSELAIATACRGHSPLPAGEMHEIAKLIHHLLTTHHCLTELNINDDRPYVNINDDRPYLHNILLGDALCNNEWIKRIKVHASTIDSLGPRNIFRAAMLSLRNLEHLEFDTEAQCGTASVRMLSTMLRKSRSLRSLCIPRLTPNHDDSTILLTAITANICPLKVLSLNSEVIQQAPIECVVDFAEHLKHGTSLVRLSICGSVVFCGPAMSMILEALSENKTIQTLEFRMADICRRFIALLGSIVESNDTLHHLHIFPLCHYFFRRPVLHGIWIEALVTNETLQEVTLPLCVMAPKHWAVFFSVLSMKLHLNSVAIVGIIPDGFDFQQLCQALRNSGVEGKVTFSEGLGSQCYGENTALLKCRAFGHVVASSHYSYGNAQLGILVRQLCSLSHVTSLTLRIDPYANNESLSPALVEYIETTTTLKTLRVDTGPHDVPREHTRIFWTLIIESLGRNRSIAELLVRTKCVGPEEVEQLADTISRSQVIRKLTVQQCGRSRSSDFVKRLAENVADNYSLVKIRFPQNLERDSYPIWRTARRNTGYVVRASQFLRGAVLDRHDVTVHFIHGRIGGALERISRHRALLSEFADEEHITEDEARAAVYKGLRVVKDMPSFMRLAGVVKDEVTCYPREDSYRQLDDLNQDCWLEIRQYLMLEDVRGCCTQPDSY